MEKTKNNPPAFRFDDAYESVYTYDVNDHAYFFLGSYLSFGLDKSMSEDKMESIVRAYGN